LKGLDQSVQEGMKYPEQWMNFSNTVEKTLYDDEGDSEKGRKAIAAGPKKQGRFGIGDRGGVRRVESFGKTNGFPAFDGELGGLPTGKKKKQEPAREPDKKNDQERHAS